MDKELNTYLLELEIRELNNVIELKDVVIDGLMDMNKKYIDEIKELKSKYNVLQAQKLQVDDLVNFVFVVE